MRYLKSPVPTMIAMPGLRQCAKAHVNEAISAKQSSSAVTLNLTRIVHLSIAKCSSKP